MAFKDHFSSQSAAYSRYRPAYPPALIRYVASLARDRRVAIDCATGNGQAAVALAEHFETVLAIDGSQSQLARAQVHGHVHYAAGLAEQLPVPESSVGLVAAAQAAHWFDLDRFHAECRRVLVPGGVVAIWTYEKFRVDPGVDAVIDQFYSGVVGPYWPPERRFVRAGLSHLCRSRGARNPRHRSRSRPTGTCSWSWATSPRGRPCNATRTCTARTRCRHSRLDWRPFGRTVSVAGCAGRSTCASAGA